MESVRIYKFQIYVNAHFTGRGQIYTDHTFIWNLLLKHGHSESCQPAAICITMNLDVIILVLTELSSSVVRRVGDKGNGSCCTQQRESCHTFVFTLGGRPYLFIFSLGVQRVSGGDKVLGPNEEEALWADSAHVSIITNPSPKHY